jgi:putative restriction endonuclease
MPHTFDQYIKAFIHLNCAPRSRSQIGYGKRKHKPLLLLSVFTLMEQSIITGNIVHATKELKEMYTHLRSVWLNSVELTWDTDAPHHPFCRLNNDNFENMRIWILNEDIGSSKSPTWKKLADGGVFAAIPEDLYEQLLASQNMLAAKKCLIDEYFSFGGEREKAYSTSSQERAVIATDHHSTYAANQVKPGKRRSYESHVRHPKFTKEILELYGYRCAISGYKILNPKDAFLLDAAHIEPFSFKQNNQLSNGISLTPTVHRAFDRGHIAIADDYTVLVKEGLEEEQDPGGLHLNQFKGKKIHLPKQIKFWPDRDKLSAHRREFGF